MAALDLPKILWENVQALMKERWKVDPQVKRDGENLTRLAREAKVGPGTVQRIKESETSVGIDIVGKVAGVFRVAPHQLLIPRSDTMLHRLVRAWHETDHKGQLLIETAIEAAERRAADARNAGMGKPGSSDDG